MGYKSLAQKVAQYLFFTTAFGFLFGVASASLITFSFSFIFFLFFLAFLFLGLGAFSGNQERVMVTLLMCVLICSFIGGVVRFQLKSAPLTEGMLPVGEMIFYEGIITSEPEQREKMTQLQVSLTRFKEGEVFIDTKQKVLVRVLPGESFSYGDKLRLFGELKEPENFETTAGRVFDYKSYLRAKGISYLLLNPHIEKIGENEGSLLKQKLFFIKERFVREIQKNIGNPESALLIGTLLGGGEVLPKAIQEEFRKTGLVHIIVLSGYNITIVVVALMAVFRFLPFLYRILLGAGGIILFSILVGGEATVVRAAVMALIALLATLLRRQYNITRALVLAGVVMVYVNPAILFFDLSFELSFLSTVGLIYVAPLLERFTSALPQRFGFREIVTATLATQLFVLPFILYSIGMFSSVALIANLLVLPLIPLIMLLGFLTGSISFVSVLLVKPLSFVTYYLLHYVLVVAHKMSTLPFATFSVPSFNASAMVLCYVLFFAYLFYLKTKTPVMPGV